MRVLVFIVVLFCGNLSKADIIASCGKDDFQVNGQNSKRSFGAFHLKIANMHELKHDPGLEKVARENFKSCSDYKHGKNFRVLAAPHEKEYDAIFEKHCKAVNYTGTYSEYEEAFHTLQTSFIVCRLNVNCTRTIDGQTFENSTVMLLGHRGTLSASDFKIGPPGSQCPNGKTEKDLCIAGPKGAVSSTDSKNSPPSAQCPNGECIAESNQSSGKQREGMESMIHVFFLIAFLNFV